MWPQSNSIYKVKSLHILLAVVSKFFKQYLASQRAIHHVSMSLAQKQGLAKNAECILYHRCDVLSEHFALVLTQN
jgi:hypothetical protein